MLQALRDDYVTRPLRFADLADLLARHGAAEPIEPARESSGASVPVPVFDSPGVPERVHGDRGLLAELLNIFCGEYPQRLAEFRTALAARDASRSNARHIHCADRLAIWEPPPRRKPRALWKNWPAAAI